ncbi:translation protein SH3-like domain-containing protein [Lentinula aff. detonsa]|uniref:Large ribosomal subunit protein uL2m n=2 Tax=Lentinula TaxID=5352 RepID=A0AA38KXB2_9AGAR|nr:translation protein SH3-like domain-containing protein [Lentinula aff. detonsa]KAJ3980031.1 translation protein SH3-like domain-containing protein [Lentinula detonsa]
MFATLRRCAQVVSTTSKPTSNHFFTGTATTSKTSRRKSPLTRVSVDGLFQTYKPVTPGLRHLKRPLNPHIYAGRPVRLLTYPLRKSGGRNNTGRITVRHRGGGHRQRIRIVDWKRAEGGIWDVVRIEYDPGRSAHLALIKRRRTPETAEASAPVDGEEPQQGSGWAYILATEGMRAGDSVQSFRSGIPPDLVPGLNLTLPGSKSKNQSDSSDNEDADTSSSLALGIFRALTLKSGNVLPLALIPPGTVVHNLTLTPTGPARLVRSAGTSALVVAHENADQSPSPTPTLYSQVRLASGEIRRILQSAFATIGTVSNPLWKNRSLGKAGRSRWLGWRPAVRGVAMNAKDHPHGGGRGKGKSNKHPVSIWGWGTKGTRTRKPGPKGPKNSNKLVIKERPRGVDRRKI